MVQLDIRAFDLRLLSDRDCLMDEWGRLCDIFEGVFFFAFGSVLWLHDTAIYDFSKERGTFILIPQLSKTANMQLDMLPTKSSSSSI